MTGSSISGQSTHDGQSYYGRPVVKAPVWRADIPGYLVTGGLASGSALLAAGADLAGRPALRRAARLTCVGALGASTYFLIHDLGRPERFHHMLRVMKPTSPLSVGTWLLTAFAPGAAVAAAAEVAGWLRGRGGGDAPRGRFVPHGRGVPGGRGVARGRFVPDGRSVAGARGVAGGRGVARVGRVGGLAAAALAPAVGTYTAVLLANTAVPSWHAAYPHLPFVFAGSALASAAGVGLVAAPPAQTGPARRLALAGAALELAGARGIETGLGLLGEPYRAGRAGRLLRLGRDLTAAGVLGSWLGRRSRVLSALSGAALVGAAVATRFGIYAAGIASAEDPRYTVQPQRERLDASPRSRP